MELIKKNWFFFTIIVIVFVVDRSTKEYIVNFFLSQKIEIYYFNQFLNFVLVWNTGLAFGILENNPSLYNYLSLFIIFIILFLFFLMLKTQNKFEKLSISFIVGGALGNFYDRAIFGKVPDFIDLHYLDFHWFVFNVSDIIITLGIIFLLLKEIIKKNGN